MFHGLKRIIDENWVWRRQAWSLAVMDLVKSYRGAALGWIWLFVKPVIYIAVFWFAIDIGMRSGSPVNGYPFIYWLAAGIFPWFFIRDMLDSGSSVLNRYSFLVNRLRFPLSVISTFFAISRMLVCVGTLAVMMFIAACAGYAPTIYWLQIPLVLVITLLFWIGWSIAISPLCAFSQDFSNLVKTVSMPLFWMSGILFQLGNMPEWVQAIMRFNPVTWCAESIRDSLIYNQWIWSQKADLGAFVIVFVVMWMVAGLSFGKLSKEVADVL